MFKKIRIAILLLVLVIVSLNTWLTQSRSTDWNDSVYVKIYPINADSSTTSSNYIQSLELRHFHGIEDFLEREASRYGHGLAKPVRMELGTEIDEQPPTLGSSPSVFKVMWWSMQMRWWASDVASSQDHPAPDVRIFVRYHTPSNEITLENSVGLQKGMVGVVNAFASRQLAGINNVVIAHEFLHTLGASDKYHPADGFPEFPLGYAEPDRSPLYPQKYAEIMGGRIPESEKQAHIPKNLKYVIIGDTTAQEINLR